MKRNLLVCLLLLSACLLGGTEAAAQYKFGYFSYNAVYRAMPEYAEAQKALAEIKEKYDAETRYNEEVFRKMYVDFLQGQKDFPENILLKRQKELEDAMERGVRFREEVKTLLNQAEAELQAPIRAKLDSAVRAVGMERGYEYILNTDGNTYPFIHSGCGEDATLLIQTRLQAIKE